MRISRTDGNARERKKQIKATKTEQKPAVGPVENRNNR